MKERLEAVMGVDPALRRTGLCLLATTAEGGFRLLTSTAIEPVGPSKGARLLALQKQFGDVLNRWGSSAVYMEKSSLWWAPGKTRAVSLKALEAARAVIHVACAERGVPISEVPLAGVRTAVLGRANAPKGGLMVALQRMGIEIPRRGRGFDADVANAVAVAVYGLATASEAHGGFKGRLSTNPLVSTT